MALCYWQSFVANIGIINKYFTREAIAVTKLFEFTF